MTPKNFLENCKILALKVRLNGNDIVITGEPEFIEQAYFELEQYQELRDGVTAILRAPSAIDEKSPQTQERQAEIKYESAELELDGVTACSKALMKLTDAQKSKLRGFIAACQCRGLILITDDKRRVYLDTVDGEPIRRDVSDLFTWIYGFSECALLVYLGTQDATIAEELNNTAIRVGCDLFTAAYLVTGIKRDLYLATCEDWKFKPQNLPQDASLIIGDKSV
ncbi:MAG: hypothetical protein IJ520_02160 [Synergistaceae bacterium]|nr:hypothetical protein [Synergistaceae bacterium]